MWGKFRQFTIDVLQVITPGTASNGWRWGLCGIGRTEEEQNTAADADVFTCISKYNIAAYAGVFTCITKYNTAADADVFTCISKYNIAADAGVFTCISK